MALDAGTLAEDLVGWGMANYVALKLMDDINTARSAFSDFVKVVDTIRRIFVAMYATGEANVPQSSRKFALDLPRLPPHRSC